MIAAAGLVLSIQNHRRQADIDRKKVVISIMFWPATSDSSENDPFTARVRIVNAGLRSLTVENIGLADRRKKERYILFKKGISYYRTYRELFDGNSDHYYLDLREIADEIRSYREKHRWLKIRYVVVTDTTGERFFEVLPQGFASYIDSMPPADT